MYLLTRSKFIGKQEKIVLIKNKHKTLGPAARAPCSSVQLRSGTRVLRRTPAWAGTTPRAQIP